MKAAQLLQEGENALVLFTGGTDLDIEPDGTGLTGRWKVDPDRVPDRIILYVRPEGSNTADIFTAINTGVAPSEIEGRSWIFLSNITNVGSTDVDWFEFAQGGQNPVRYIS